MIIPNTQYAAANGDKVTVLSVQFNRVIYFIAGYELSVVIPLSRFEREFKPVNKKAGAK